MASNHLQAQDFEPSYGACKQNQQFLPHQKHCQHFWQTFNPPLMMHCSAIIFFDLRLATPERSLVTRSPEA